jgi:hypothetical protein
MHLALGKSFLLWTISALFISCLNQNETEYVDLSPCSSRETKAGTSFDSGTVVPVPKHEKAYVCYDTILQVHAFVEVSGREKVKVVLNRKMFLDGVHEPGLYDIDLNSEIGDENTIAVFLSDSLVFGLRFRWRDTGSP